MNSVDCRARAYTLISSYLQGLLAEARSVRHGRNAEALHRMRVSSRRLRATLRVFRDLLSARKARRWRKSVRKIGRALGIGRELDIQLRFLLLVKRELRDPVYASGIRKLIRILERERAKAQRKIIEVLDDRENLEKLTGLQSHLRALARSMTRDAAFAADAEEMISERLAHMLMYERYVCRPSRVRELHLMRIAAKNLRYTLEIFNPFCRGRIDSYIRSVRRVQDMLGEIHEHDVWIEYLRGLGKERPIDGDLARTVSYLERKCVTLRGKTYRRFVSLWKELKRKRTWERLRAAV